MYQITLGIDGMMCGMCESHINDAVLPEAELRPVIAKTGYELTGYACAPYEKKGLFHRR